MKRARQGPGGRFNVPGAAKVYALKAASATIPTGGKATLKLKISRKAQKAIKSALRRHKTVKAKVTVTVTDAAGNRTIRTRVIRLRA